MTVREWIESEKRPFGWFTDTEGQAYIQAVKHYPKGVIVELGSYLGRSLSYILPAAKELSCEVYAVDLWNWEKSSDPTVQCPPCSLKLFQRNLERMNASVIIIVSDSVKAAAQFHPESVSLIMLDTTHRCDDTLREIDAWWPNLKIGGIMLFHDYGRTSSYWQGRGDYYTFVKEAVDARFGKPEQVTQSLALVTKK